MLISSENVQNVLLRLGILYWSDGLNQPHIKLPTLGQHRPILNNCMRQKSASRLTGGTAPVDPNGNSPFSDSRLSLMAVSLILLAFSMPIAFWSTSAAAKQEPLKVTEIAPGIYVHEGQHAIYTPKNRGDISNCGFIVGEEAVAVIDSCGTFLLGQALRATIKSITDKPIRYVVNTHMHPDHVFGNAAFSEDKPQFIAHHKLGRGLASRAERYLAVNGQDVGEAHFAGTKVILPTREIKKTESIDLGGRVVKLLPQPTAHTDNDLVIFDEKTGTLFLGDLLFAHRIPALDGSIIGWIKVLKELEKIPAKRVVPGHGPASLGWPDALQPINKYLQTIIDDVRRMIGEGKTMSDAIKEAGWQEKDAWALFELYHMRNVSAAFAELEWE